MRIKQNVVEKFSYALLVLNCFLFTQGAYASPTSLNYQGRILKTDGTALEYSNVSFIFQITDPSGTCIIYQEQVNGYNMSNSGGMFDVPIGQGTVTYPTSGSFSVLDAFNNTSTFTCQGGSPYTAAMGDTRKLRVQFYDGVGWKTVSPDNTIRSVPYAGYSYSAQKLGTYNPTDFLLKAGLPTCTANTFLYYDGTSLTCVAVSGANGGTVTNVTSANAYLTVAYPTNTPALTLHVGTTANTVAAGDDSRIVNAVQNLGGTPSVQSGVDASKPAAPADGTIYFASDTLKIYQYISGSWTTLAQAGGSTPGGAAGGDLSGTYPNPVLATIGTASTGTKISYDAKGRVTSSTTLSATDIPALDWSKITSGIPTTLAGYGITDAVQNLGGSPGIKTGADASKPASPTAGTVYFATDTLRIYQYNSGAWSLIASASGSGGTITDLTGDVSATGSGSVTATVNSVGGSTAANVHSAELLANAATSSNTANTIVKRDASGNFTAGTITANLTGAASANVLKAGDTMSGNLTHNAGTGDIYTAGTGGNTASVQGPSSAIGTSYVMRLPTGQGSGGQVLTNDGSGNLYWNTPSTTATAYSGILPVANGGTNSSTSLNNNRIMVSSGGAIVEASALNNGQLLIGSTGAAPVAANITAGSGITVTNGAGSITVATTGLQSSTLADGKILVGNGSSVATAQTPGGDVTMTDTASFTVAKIQGTPVSATTPSAAGQVLRYNGTTQYVPAKLYYTDLINSTSLSPWPGTTCTSGQAVTWSSASDSFTCTTITLSASNFPSQSANTFLAAPNGSAGVPTFRVIASADLPAAGTAGTYGSASQVPVFTTDAYGRVTSVTNTSITASATALTGIVPIANGGTGASSTSQNYVFAGPTSGSGAPSFRALTQADLPSASLSGSGTAGYVPYYSAASTLANSAMYYTSSKVGIGNTGPSYPLDVTGVIRGSGEVISTSANAFRMVQGNYGSFWRNDGTNTYFLLTASGDQYGTWNSLRPLTINDVSGDVTVNSVTALAAGNVGIGTASPSYKLEVNGDIRADGWLRTSGATGWYSDTYGGGWNMSDSTWIRSYGSKNVYIDQTLAVAGSLGVGTTSPSQALEVNGNVKATSFISTSDRRLKKDIVTTDGLNTILKLRGVRFRWKSNDVVEYGTIAQEVEQVLPDLVVTDPKTGLKAVKYIGLIAPLIEATKDLNNKCDMSTEQINKLAVAVENVQADVSTLKRKLASVEDENAQMKEDLKALSARLKALEDKEK